MCVFIVGFSECGGTYQQNAATFIAPVFRGDKIMDEAIRCEWRITATHGEKIILNITNLDISKSPDCSENYVEVSAIQGYSMVWM